MSITNVDIENNLFHIGDMSIEIPIRIYEINDISSYIQNYLEKRRTSVVIWANNNTLKSGIVATKTIYIIKERNIGALLRFSTRELPAVGEQVTQ